MYDHKECLLDPLPFVGVFSRVITIEEVEHLQKVHARRDRFGARQCLLFALGIVLNELPLSLSINDRSLSRLGDSRHSHL